MFQSLARIDQQPSTLERGDTMSAANELQDFLHDGEVIEAIVFVPWGGGDHEEDYQLIPANKQGVLYGSPSMMDQPT